MEKLRRGFGVYGDPLVPGVEYPGHRVSFEDGDPAAFWVSVETRARRRLQERIQERLRGAAPLGPRHGLVPGGLVLARWVLS
jgi:hypothetical protein